MFKPPRSKERVFGTRVYVGKDISRGNRKMRRCMDGYDLWRGNGMTYDFWLEGWLNLPGFDLEPIDSPEERVGADVLLTLGTTSKPLLWCFGQKLGWATRYTKNVQIN